jgi:hypothetical protein
MSSSRSIAAARQKRSGDTVQKPQQLQQPQQGLKPGLGQKPQMQQQGLKQQQPQPQSRPKLSVGDAFGLVTLRLGRVEQFMIQLQEHGGISSGNNNSIPENSQLIDKSVFTNMISRLDGLEKKDTNSKQMSVLESELRSTKDLLISLMAKFDKFNKETDEKFADFDCAIADIEGKMDTNTNGGQDINDDNAISCDLQSELNCDTEGITFEISEN